MAGRQKTLEPKTPQQIAAARAVLILGGPVEAARTLLGDADRYQTIQSWVVHRVPLDHCPAVERKTRELGNAVRCEDLRPDIAWEVLRLKIKRAAQPVKA